MHTTPTPADVLLKAADIIETKGWTQEVYARDRSGAPVATTNSSAWSFCLLGSVVNAAHKLKLPPSGATERLAETALREMLLAEYRLNITTWNDERCKSKAEAVEALHAAAMYAALDSRFG